MKRFLKLPTLVVAIIVLAIAGGLWWWHTRGSSPSSYRTAVVKRGDVVAVINASGTIEPTEVVDVGAQVAGLIKSFGTDINGKPVDYGSVVDVGAVLATIDDSVYAADLSVAKAGELSADATLEQMNAKLDQAAAEWKRAQDLFANKLVAQVDYDTDKANYEVAKANVSVAKSGIAQAKADLDKAQRNLDFCIIKSPVKGVIIDRRVNIGQTVVASLNAPSLFLIAEDLTKMQIWVSVNEADVGRIKVGSPVTFTCSAFPGRQFKGTVGQMRLNATMTQNIVIYTVVVNTDNLDNVLLPYLTANVNFVLREETNALLVANEALRWSPSSLGEIAPEDRSQIAQADPPGDAAKPDNGAKKKDAVIWLKEGDYVRPLQVKVGTTDGVDTAVTAADLREGAVVVIGETASGARAAAQNPFVPHFIRH
ncbi:MAG TPA: efflux RND transporter periplasmic adaptor subunit [Verrucomicrobiae bacterium]|jgi:HlyD family secretion protein|nr:efflux RND transporter periplasmic adaptor subunit [Verrucomicrobiae bacterium]